MLKFFNILTKEREEENIKQKKEVIGVSNKSIALLNPHCNLNEIKKFFKEQYAVKLDLTEGFIGKKDSELCKISNTEMSSILSIYAEKKYIIIKYIYYKQGKFKELIKLDVINRSVMKQISSKLDELKINPIFTILQEGKR